MRIFVGHQKIEVAVRLECPQQNRPRRYVSERFPIRQAFVVKFYVPKTRDEPRGAPVAANHRVKASPKLQVEVGNRIGEPKPTHMEIEDIATRHNQALVVDVSDSGFVFPRIADQLSNRHIE